MFLDTACHIPLNINATKDIFQGNEGQVANKDFEEFEDFEAVNNFFTNKAMFHVFHRGEVAEIILTNVWSQNCPKNWR